MSFVAIFGQMMSLFLIMVAGYVIYKTKMIDDRAIGAFTKLVLNVSLPAQVFISFVSNRGKISNQALLEVLGVAVLSYVLYAVVGLILVFLVRAPRKQWGMYVMMMMFGNVGFMGYPVIQAILGDDAIVYAVVFNVLFNIIIYSVGIQLIGGETAGKFNPRLLLNIPMLSALLGVAWFFTSIPIPAFLEDSLNYLGNTTTPMAMLILGGTIARMEVKELFDDWRVYVFTVFRLLVMPAVILLCMNLLHEQQELIRGTAVILAATPVATNTTMLTIEYGGDVKLVSKGIFFSTVLSVITIPLVAMCL